MRISDWSSDVCSSDLVAAAWGGAEGADVIAFVVDGKGGVGPKVTAIAEAPAPRRPPKYLILHTVHIAHKARLPPPVQRLHPITHPHQTFSVSAATAHPLPAPKPTSSTPRPHGPCHFTPEPHPP